MCVAVSRVALFWSCVHEFVRTIVSSYSVSCVYIHPDQRTHLNGHYRHVVYVYPKRHAKILCRESYSKPPTPLIFTPQLPGNRPATPIRKNLRLPSEIHLPTSPSCSECSCSKLSHRGYSSSSSTSFSLRAKMLTRFWIAQIR